MAVTSPDILPVIKGQQKTSLPWYNRDLYKYLATFAGLAVIYVGLRLYQGAYGVLV